MVSFVQNGLCTKLSLYELIPVFLYEVVSFLRSGLCTKWSLYQNAGVHVNNLWYNSKVEHIWTYIDIWHLFIFTYLINCTYFTLSHNLCIYWCFINYTYFWYNLFMTFTHLRSPTACLPYFRPSFCYLLFHIFGTALW